MLCIHSDTGLCETCFKYEQEIEKLREVPSSLKAEIECRKEADNKNRKNYAILDSENIQLALERSNLKAQLATANKSLEGFSEEKINITVFDVMLENENYRLMFDCYVKEICKEVIKRLKERK